MSANSTMLDVVILLGCSVKLTHGSRQRSRRESREVITKRIGCRKACRREQDEARHQSGLHRHPNRCRPQDRARRRSLSFVGLASEVSCLGVIPSIVLAHGAVCLCGDVPFVIRSAISKSDDRRSGKVASVRDPEVELDVMAVDGVEEFAIASRVGTRLNIASWHVPQTGAPLASRARP